MSPAHTNIEFVNRVTDTPSFNIFNYYNFYNGGGVAAGDINNDGLQDLFFVGNSTSNKLYLNKGNFQFQDITESANVGGDEGGWSTGVTMVDINSDYYLDIYVSQVNYLTKEGANQLFINNQDGTFSEKAKEYGLNFEGFSTQASFFDYNNDGRLDVYLLNQSFPSEKIFGEADVLRNQKDPNAGDKLFRNDGGTFTDVTDEAGIYSSALGLGLGVAISDINRDGWLDIYVGNDAHEDDYLYINNGDGTFSEGLYASVGHTSRSSMGNDIADFSNDGKVDIISVDMMAEDRETYMTSGGPSLYLVYDKYRELGYGPKNERNTLQINRGNNPDGTPLFSDIAFSAGVARSSWSWAPLFFDMNNDGYKDLYISNGMVRRTNNLDATRKREVKAARSNTNSEFESQDELNALLNEMPEERKPNYAFKNNGDLTFTNSATAWGLDQTSISSGAAYTDLDNDGDLDLVVNNSNMPSFVYQNHTTERDSTRHSLQIDLKGKDGNTFGIGTKIIAYRGDDIFYHEQVPSRGFQSSVGYTIHMGTGSSQKLDSLHIIWPDSQYQRFNNVPTDQRLTVNQMNASGTFDYTTLRETWDDSKFQDISESIEISFSHKENEFNDYEWEPLMPFRLSTQGPALTVGDVTGDGLDDFFVGGAKGQAGVLFIQNKDGGFNSSNEEVLTNDRHTEDVDATFFDANGDGVLDLYVVSGGSELTANRNLLRDRLYINDGSGNFRKSENSLPEIAENGSVVISADYDNDGDEDLFVGGRSTPQYYGKSPQSYLLENNGQGIFKDVTQDVVPQVKEVGMVTDAKWATISSKEYPDLVVAGEWMPVHMFRNNGTVLENSTEEFGLADKSGLWQKLLITDLNSDGYQDIIAGNFGTNSRLQASPEKPLRLYINDFTGDGLTTPVIAENIDGAYYPYEQLHELLMKIEFLVRRVESYEDYASKTMAQLFGEDAISSAEVKEINELASVTYLNQKNQTFSPQKLPLEAQLFPMMAMTAIEGDNKAGLLMGGNLHDVKQSAGGKQDASYGLQLVFNQGSFSTSNLQESGFYVNGEVREIKQINIAGENVIIVAVNDGSLKFFRKRTLNAD